MAQADFQDVFGLAVRQLEGVNQRRLRFIGFTDDPDDLVDIEQDRNAAFENMDAVIDFLQTELRAPRDRNETERNPLAQDVAKAFLARPAIAADHHEVDRGTAFERGLRKQQMHEFRLVLVL